MDAAAPVAAESERSGVEIAERPDSEALDPAETGLAGDGTVPARRRVLSHFMAAGPVRRYRAVISWSHTPLALLLGSIFTAAFGLATLVAFVAVGLVGAGTHTPPALYGPPPADDASRSAGPTPPDDTRSIFTTPAPLLPQPPALNSALSQELSNTVLQMSDLGGGYTLLNAGTTGADAVAGLLASYHAIYQRPLIDGSGYDRSIAVLSVLGLYRDVQTASFRLSDVETDRLGVEAGLPGLSAEIISATTVADESRVIHLTGTTAGVNIGAYLVQFRRGRTDAIVGVAAVLGSESLQQAIDLADVQDGRIVAAALPGLRP